MYCSCLLLLSIDSLVPAAYRSLQCQLPFIVSSSVTLSPHIMPMPNFAGVFENRTVQYGLSLVLAYYSLKYFFVPLISEVMNAPDPKETEAKSSARSALVRHFSSQRRQVPDTNPYEERLIADLVFPEQLDTTLDDIGGLEQLKQEMYETVILPLRSPHILAAMQRTNVPATPASASASSLLSAPRGVLLYGPPGCGKVSL